MATVQGVTLTPNEVTTVPVEAAGAVEVTSDGTAAVYYTLDGSEPTPSSTLVIAEGMTASRAAAAGATVKLLSEGNPTVAVAAYSPTEAEATAAGADVHATLQAEIQAAQEMIDAREPDITAVMVTAQQASEEHAALHARIDAIQLTPGPQGPAGPTGPEGKSAYQVARDVGYGGTQTQWVASLVGPQGPQGQTGPQGIQGTAGQAGQAGPQGPKGDQGIQGPAGQTGPQGPAGLLSGVVKSGTLALTGNLAASASGSYTVTLPDMGGTDYSVAASLEATTALLDKLTISGVVSKTATSVVVRVRNGSSTTNLSGTTLRVLAVRLI